MYKTDETLSMVIGTKQFIVYMYIKCVTIINAKTGHKTIKHKLLWAQHCFLLKNNTHIHHTKAIKHLEKLH